MTVLEGSKAAANSSLPPCGGGLGWGVPPRGARYIGAWGPPPTLTLPRKGGGNARLDLRRLASRQEDGGNYARATPEAASFIQPAMIASRRPAMSAAGPLASLRPSATT